MSEELVYQISLELIPGLGDRGIKQLISYCGSASSVFNTPKNKLLKIPGVGDKLVNALLSNRSLNKAEQILRKAENINAEVLHYTDKRFPSRLKQISDGPTILYKKGNGDLNSKKSIAIVGTRKATAYGKSVTDKIVSDLSAMGVTIVSGLAYGIDIQAHKACIKGNTPTFAVIAGGLDKIYPSGHRKYAEDMLSNGGIVSECIPGTKPDPHLFPKRNRIIAGMTDATIVVEAAAKGGALITAHVADSYNKLVLAVPGDLNHIYSEGTNKLIASQKALIYSGVEDLIYHLHWDVKENQQAPLKLPEMSAEESILFELLEKAQKPLDIDLLAIQSQFPVNQVASILLGLEFKNVVKSLPGKKYELVN